ncbi:hypothetical protein JKP88DRAFT_233966, partial [Tribonema minus]
MEAVRDVCARQEHALAYIAHREAERKQRSEEQHAAKRIADAENEQGCKKARKELVVKADTAAVPVNKLPIEVNTVNLWDACEREEHTLAYFAYTQRLAEERRAAKRAADTAKEQESNRPQPLPAAPRSDSAIVCDNMDSCSARITAPTQQVATAAQPDTYEPEPPTSCAVTPSKLPVDVTHVNLWDARAQQEHALAYFAYTQKLAEERRAAKRAAESAKEQVSNEPKPLPAAPRETIACGTIMDSCSVRVHPTKCNSSLNVLVSMDEDVPRCTKAPVMMQLIRRWATRQYLAEERRAAKRAADTAKEQESNRPQPLPAAPRSAIVCDNMDSCSARITAPTQQVATAAQPDSYEPEPPTSCAVTPSKLPVDVTHVNLWDARAQQEHALAYFAYTQKLAEERRAAKRAAESAKEQVSNEPKPLSAAPRETIAFGTIMDSCSVRVHPTKCNSSLNVLVSMDEDAPRCTKAPVMMQLIRRWATRQYLAEERRAAKRAADTAKEQESNRPQPLPAAPRSAIVCDNMDSCSARITAPTQQVATAAQPDSYEPEPPTSCAVTPSNLPVDVTHVNLWDARAQQEHALAYFAYTQKLAEERRAAKRAAESAKEQVSNEPKPLSAAPRETIAFGTIMDSCSVRVHPTKCNSSLNVLVSMDEDVPRCTKAPVMMQLIRRWATRQYLAEERRAAKRAADTAKEQESNRPQPLPAAPRSAIVCDNMDSCSARITAPTQQVATAAQPDSYEPEPPTSCAVTPSKLPVDVTHVNLWDARTGYDAADQEVGHSAVPASFCRCASCAHHPPPPRLP